MATMIYQRNHSLFLDKPKEQSKSHKRRMRHPVFRLFDNSSSSSSSSRSGRCLLVFFLIVQLVVMYDTVKKAPKNTSNKGNTSVHIRLPTNTAAAAPESDNGNEAIKKPGGDDDDDVEDNDDDDSLNAYTYTYSDDIVVENNNKDDSRLVYWMDKTAISEADYFSGAWCMPVEKFVTLDVKAMLTKNDASHRVWFEHEGDARMTVDWLDFAVESASFWYDKLDVCTDNNNDVAISKIRGNQLKYIRSTPEFTKALVSSKENSASDKPLLHPTIAIVSHASIQNGSNERSRNLTVSTLGTTIASLLRIGVGRIVVTGIDDMDAQLAADTFQLIANTYTAAANTIVTTELSYVKLQQKWYKTDMEASNRQRGSLYGLKDALEGNLDPTYTALWLGTTQKHTYWKYVYSTEPDLVLQTRLSSLPAIHKALEKDRVLMPHPLLAVTHVYDLTGPDNTTYDGSNSYLPAVGKFKTVLDLNGLTDMCCDDGKERPTWKKKDDPGKIGCASWWYDCGYTLEWNELKESVSEETKHRRILHYTPLIRLTTGSNLVSISGSEHERKCRPVQQKTPDDVCQRPGSSGRSFAKSENAKEE